MPYLSRIDFFYSGFASSTCCRIQTSAGEPPQEVCRWNTRFSRELPNESPFAPPQALAGKDARQDALVVRRPRAHTLARESSMDNDTIRVQRLTDEARDGRAVVDPLKPGDDIRVRSLVPAGAADIPAALSCGSCLRRCRAWRGKAPVATAR